MPQNSLQSNEIRFGSTFEATIKQYLSKTTTYYSLSKRYEMTMIQSKKREQISNFKKKLEALIDIYGDRVRWGLSTQV